MKRNNKVLVAMSGGLDSSVTAMLLKEQGYDLVGITMKVWIDGNSTHLAPGTGGDSEAIEKARALALKLDFPHYVIDLQAEFKIVVNNFIDEYLKGRTPNPCVVCNPIIKFGELIKKADELDCDYIATGHYAKIINENGRYFIKMGNDSYKDQSYFLWKLSQDSLKRILFPLGEMKKEDIRNMAAARGFQHIAAQKESYDVCFIPDGDYRSFLKRQMPEIEQTIGKGSFYLTDGTYLGEHNGYPFYTIGQRKGLVVAVGHPLYVVDIQPQTNKIILGTREELSKQTMWVKDINISKYEKLSADYEVITKIRYKDKGTLSRINFEGEKIKVEFYTPVSAIAPGQSAVFYEGNDVIGGGIIEAVER